MSEVRFGKISTRIIVKTVFFHLSSFNEFIKSCWHTLSSLFIFLNRQTQTDRFAFTITPTVTLQSPVNLMDVVRWV